MSGNGWRRTSEYLESAEAKLKPVVAATLLLIFVLLQMRDRTS
jgi:Cu/Ag efflux pump CusA